MRTQSCACTPWSHSPDAVRTAVLTGAERAAAHGGSLGRRARTMGRPRLHLRRKTRCVATLAQRVFQAAAPSTEPPSASSHHSYRTALGRHADSRSSVSRPRCARRPVGSALPAVAGARMQLGGQLKALAWGTAALGLGRAVPAVGVGLAVQAVVDRSSARLALAGALLAARRGHSRRRHDAAPDGRHQLDHRRGPRPAAAGPQDGRAGLGADPPGRGRRGGRRLHRRRGEDRLVRRGGLPLRRRRC